MARADLLNILYSKEASALDFHFEQLHMPSMYKYLSPYDIEELRILASSAKYASKINFKYKEINRIMTNRGFKKFHSGTNRVVYSYLEDMSFLVKIAVDKVGMRDNPCEYRNQFLLKPFVSKTFEVSPCGTVATVERVEPITSRQEFLSIAGDVFDMLNTRILGEYILEDIGSDYFMNFGIRKGFGVVLLDYPYLFKLDGNKLYCNKVLDNSHICNGVIDYDAGFNNLVCSSCGKRYLAMELKQATENKMIIMKGHNDLNLNIRIKRGNDVVSELSSNRESETIIRKKKG